MLCTLSISGLLLCQDRNIGLPEELFYSLTSNSLDNVLHSSTTPLEAIKRFKKEFGALSATSKALNESYQKLETAFIKKLFFRFPLLIDAILQNNTILTPKAYIVNSSVDEEKEFVKKINTLSPAWKNKLSVVALSLAQDKQLKALRYLYYGAINHIKLNDSVIKYVTDNIDSLDLTNIIFLPGKYLSELIVQYGVAENLAELYENKIINLNSLVHALQVVEDYIEIEQADRARMAMAPYYENYTHEVIDEEYRKKERIIRLRANQEFLKNYTQKINQ